MDQVIPYESGNTVYVNSICMVLKTKFTENTKLEE